MAFRHMKKVFTSISSRVKCVELHPTEPMLASAMFDGTVQIYNSNDWSILRTIHVSPTKAVRCVRWMPSLQAVITGGDDFTISAFDYNTGTLLASYPKAHEDIIRAIAVHPTQPLILSASDDNSIKLFKIEKNKITLVQEFTGHRHFVMDVKFNPKDPSTFASASLDTTIKFWGLQNSSARFTLNGHEAGVNCIEFFPGSDRPYLASGSDDYSIRIWDYQGKSCIRKIQGSDQRDLNFHTGNITAIRFHPKFPLLISTAEDNTVFIWNTLTFAKEKKLDCGKKRGWTIDCNDSTLALGFDEGIVVYQFGSSPILVTSDANGKTFWAHNNDIQLSNLAQASDLEDGKQCEISVKELATTEIYPATIAFNTTGRYIAVTSGTEYAIFTALAWRSKACGNCKEFAWGIGDTYATRSESGSDISVTTGFNNTKTFTPDFACRSIFGGALLGVSADGAICFFDWATFQLIRQIDVKANNLWWSQEGNQVAISTGSELYILEYNDGAEDEEQLFVVTYEGDTTVKSACWSNGVFFYTNETTANFVVAGHKEVITRFDKPLTITCYVPKVQRLFLCDRDYNFYSYSVPLDVLFTFMNILTADEEEETEPIDKSSIPEAWRERFSAVFEEKRDFKNALLFAESEEKKFELALKIPDIKLATSIARKTNSLTQWRQISNIAMKTGEMELLKEALKITGDENGLLLLNSVCGNKKEMVKLADSIEESKNVSFAAYFAAGKFSKCIDILLERGRAPEAALMARTYCPSRMNECAIKWQEKLRQKDDKVTAESIALPSEYPNLFGISEEELKQTEEPEAEEEETKEPEPKPEPEVKTEKKEEEAKPKVEENAEEEQLNDEDIDALIDGIDDGDLGDIDAE